MSSLKDNARAVLSGNWKNGFTIPCQGLYPFQWNWDSGFIAIGWAHLDRDRAFQEVRSLLKGQWSNGFLPHIVFHNKEDSYYPGPDVYEASLSRYSPKIPTSGITQPPVLGFVLEELFRILGQDREVTDFIDSIYDKVYHNHDYFYTHRDPLNEGLVYICHNWEAGTDNTPVWDEIWRTFDAPDIEIHRKDTSHIDSAQRPSNREYQYYIYLVNLFKEWAYRDSLIAERSPFLVQDPLFNSALIASNNSLIRLGRLLGRPAQTRQLARWNNKAKNAMNAKLYDDQLKGYTYYDLRNGRYLKALSSSSFTPLFAGIPDKEKALEMIQHLDKGRFSGFSNENYLCASFDPQSPHYNSSRYWRGPVWINLNWLIYRGLAKYGFSNLAATLKIDSLALLDKYGFYEYFEPSKALNQELEKGYGGKNFSWSAALAIDMINDTQINV